MKKIIKVLSYTTLFLLLIASFSKVLAVTLPPEIIDYWVTPKVVHIKNDDLLKSYLSLDYKNYTKQDDLIFSCYYMQILKCYNY